MALGTPLWKCHAATRGWGPGLAGGTATCSAGPAPPPCSGAGGSGEGVTATASGTCLRGLGQGLGPPLRQGSVGPPGAQRRRTGKEGLVSGSMSTAVPRAARTHLCVLGGTGASGVPEQHRPLVRRRREEDPGVLPVPRPRPGDAAQRRGWARGPWGPTAGPSGVWGLAVAIRQRHGASKAAMG